MTDKHDVIANAVSLTEEGTSHFAKVGPLNLHYHEAGEGEPLLMLHGAGPGAGGWSNYRRNIDHFAANRRVIVPDMLGFARSDKPTEIEGGMFAFHTKAVVDLLDSLGIDQVDLIGNSMGGGIGIKLALDHPERVRRLVLMGPATFMPMLSPGPSEGMKRIFEYYEAPGPSFEKLKAFLHVMVYNPADLTDDLIQERYQASIHPDLIANPPLSRTRKVVIEPIWKDLAGVAQRTLLIWGRDDRTIQLDNAFLPLKLMQDVRLHVFGNCGHWAQWEKADEFNRLVTDFLAAE